MVSAAPTRKQNNLIQRALGRRGFYTGPITATQTEPVIKAVQKSIVASGYTGPISGTINTDTKKYVKTLAKNKGGYTGALTGDLDEASWAGYLTAIRSNA